MYLVNGWRLIDDCPGCDEALLGSPAEAARSAAKAGEPGQNDTCLSG